MTLLNDCTPAQNGSVGIPEWVPPDAYHYLSHVELGKPIRALARSAECHASTILRQIRRIETRRDDPLVDDALETLGRVSRNKITPAKDQQQMHLTTETMMPDDATFSREARRILRRLCETGAVLAIAADMEKAVVVRDGAGSCTTRTAVVDRPIAQAMALKGWIATKGTGRIIRYHITAAGRTALEQILQREAPHHDAGFAEAQTPFAEKSPQRDGFADTGRQSRRTLAEARYPPWRDAVKKTVPGFFQIGRCKRESACAKTLSWLRWVRTPP